MELPHMRRSEAERAVIRCVRFLNKRGSFELARKVRAAFDAYRRQHHGE
jgi:hypothetical protein